MGHIQTWLRYLDGQGETDKKKQIRRAWNKTVNRIKSTGTKGKDESAEMRSAMSACIVSLRKIKVNPKSPGEWVDLVDGTTVNPQSSKITRNIILKHFEKRFETLMWTGMHSLPRAWYLF